MVRNYNQIEIYEIGKNEFKEIVSYRNDYEINDIDFYEIKGNENENEENGNEEEDDMIINAKLKLKRYNIIFFDVAQNIYELKYNNEVKNKLELHFKINIQDISGISNDLKNKGLFDLDFPYYIKNSPNFIAITTDQACFLFKKEK